MYICFVIETKELLLENQLLKQQLQALEEKSQSEIFLLKHQLAELKRLIFGSKSERFVPSAAANQSSLDLFTEPVAAPPTQQVTVTYTRTESKKNKVHNGRLPIPANIERVKK